jgi:hypothetical protein
VDLTSIKTGEKDMLKNVHFWGKLPPGQINGQMLDELLDDAQDSLSRRDRHPADFKV